MNSIRYFIAVVVLVALPPGVLLWFVIHPIAGFWRTLGAGWTYAILGLPVVGMMVGLFALRAQLVSTDFGTSLPLIALGVICVAFATTITVKRKKHLTMAILSGFPELSPSGDKGKLLTEGIYGRIRHPRYVERGLYSLVSHAEFSQTSNCSPAGPTGCAQVPAGGLFWNTAAEEARHQG